MVLVFYNVLLILYILQYLSCLFNLICRFSESCTCFYFWFLQFSLYCFRFPKVWILVLEVPDLGANVGGGPSGADGASLQVRARVLAGPRGGARAAARPRGARGARRGRSALGIGRV